MSSPSQYVSYRVGHRVGQTLGRSDGATPPWLLSNPPVDVINFEPANVTLSGSLITGAVGVVAASSWVQAVGAAQPTHTASGPGFKNGVAKYGAVFDGARVLSTVNAAILACFAGSDTPYGVIICCDATVAAALRHMWSAQVGVAATGTNGLGHGATSLTRIDKGTGIAQSAGALTSGVHSLAFSMAGVTSTVHVDGVEVISAAATDDASRAISTSHIGARVLTGPAVDRGIVGTISEIAIYNRAIDATDRSRWSSYWGISV